MQVAAPAERDHPLGYRLDGLRLRDGRLDPPVLDQRTGEIGVERLPVRRIAAELLPCALVPHVGVLDLRAVHGAASERETVLRERLLDFLDRLLAEVRDRGQL